jgi:predicted transcriptional regulator of viral defense system
MQGAVDLGEPMGNAGRPHSGGVNAGRPHDRGRHLAELARRQHGVISIRQLQQLLGFSRAGVKGMVDAGRLHRIHFGVYAVGHIDLSLHGECLAAVLAVGPGALLSYYSAGWLWGIWRGSPKPIHVTAFVPRHHQAPKGITRHRARNLVEADRALVIGIPATSVARTILDLAWKLRGDQLARVLAQAEDLGLLDFDELYDVIERNRGHHAAKRLRYALATYERPIWARLDFERASSATWSALDCRPRRQTKLDPERVGDRSLCEPATRPTRGSPDPLRTACNEGPNRTSFVQRRLCPSLSEEGVRTPSPSAVRPGAAA